jgi:hypothetical protein
MFCHVDSSSWGHRAKKGATNTSADAYGGTVRLGLTLSPAGFESSVGVFLQSDSFGSELGFRATGLLAGATGTSVINAHPRISNRDTQPLGEET